MDDVMVGVGERERGEGLLGSGSAASQPQRWSTRDALETSGQRLEILVFMIDVSRQKVGVPRLRVVHAAEEEAYLVQTGLYE